MGYSVMRRLVKAKYETVRNLNPRTEICDICRKYDIEEEDAAIGMGIMNGRGGNGGNGNGGAARNINSTNNSIPVIRRIASNSLTGGRGGGGGRVGGGGDETNDNFITTTTNTTIAARPMELFEVKRRYRSVVELGNKMIRNKKCKKGKKKKKKKKKKKS